MKKFLSLLFAVLTISLTASSQEQATARVLVPSDCSMDISKGLWLAWFNGYDEYSSTVNFVPMTPEEGGRIFIASFTPEDEYYGYYFINAASATVEGYQRSYPHTYLSVRDTLCYEMVDGGSDYYSLNQVSDCALADHNYKPYNLVATPLGRDTVRFEWEVADGEYYGFYISCYVEGKSVKDFWVEPGTQRSYVGKFRFAEQTAFDYWTISANNASGYYAARGAGFTIAGDARIPTDISISSDGEKKYTIRWNAGAEVDHFIVDVNGTAYENVKAHELQVTLEDNESYSVIVNSHDAAHNDLGGIATSFNTTTQEVRDLVLHFYIPEARGFVGESGAALVWRDPDFVGDHVVALVAEGEDAPHWYKATLAGFNRSYIHYNLINATTAEAATKTIEGSSFGDYGSTETYLIIGAEENGNLYLDSYGASRYPHDYAAQNLQVTQVLNKLIFTWESSEDIQYYLSAYDEAGENIINGYKYQGDENRFEYTGFNDKAYVISRWTVTPYVNWSSISSMRVANATPFTVQPSPFTPKNLKAQDNGDGTWTFSWDAIQLDTVQQYGIEVRDAGNNNVFQRYNIRETSVTDKVNFLFSGRCSMRVYAYNGWGNQLGNAVDSFTIAPVAAHDINIRVLINPMSGYDTTEGVKFDIQSSATGGLATVDAIDDHFGWWKYILHTTERGAYVCLHDTWRSFTAYGDTCVSYTGYYEAEDCEAHANDYMPQNLLATDNGDGTWTLSWSMDYTERADHYYVQVNDSNDNYICGDDVRNALQWKTPVVASVGRYTFSVRVYNNNYNTLGYAEGNFTVAPKVERDIQLRVLVQPGAQEGWKAYTYNAEEHDWIDQVVFTPAEGGWLTHTFTTTEPAVNVRFKQYDYYYYGTDIALTDNTCVEYESEFRVVDCDKVHLQNFTLSKLQVVDLGNGKFKFAWECEDDPEYFSVQVFTTDTATAVWSERVGGRDRAITTRLNNDSTMELVWCVVPAKRIDYDLTYLEDYRVFGAKFNAEASAYIPQNVTATPNSDGRWTIKWNALPAVVTRCQVVLHYPNGNNDYLYPTMGDTTCTTYILTELGAYTASVYAMNADYESLGQASVNFTVAQVTERALTVRLLLHPDAGRSIQPLYCEMGDGVWENVEPVDESNGWYSFTFNSTMPAPKVQIFGYETTIYGDTCMQYTWGNLSAAACDAVAHDYRIKDGSLKAESEAGRVTFSWGAVEKSEYYELQLLRYNSDYDYWDTFEWMQVSDTFAVYLVPDNRDGQKIKWNVRPSRPHSLNTVEAAELVTLHKSEIILSNLKATTTDSVHYNLSWSCNNSTVQYQLQVRIAGSGLVDTQLSAKQYDFTAITGYGSYYWQVRAVDAQGEPLTTWMQAEAFDAKSSLRVISNLQGSATGRTLHFNWTTSAPRIAAELWREESGWGRTPIFPRGDSIISGNTFDFLAPEDGRYIFEVYAIVDQSPDTYTTLYEENYVYVNVFTETATHHVDISTTVGGSFFGNNPSGDYPDGYMLRLCPRSDGDYRFVCWSDGNDNECRMITVTQDTALIALYEPLTEQHVVIAAENGWIRKTYTNDTVARIDTTVLWGYSINIEAIPNEGYDLYEWSDGYSRTETYRYLNLDSDTTIIAVFKPICYVTVAAGEGGRVQVSGANDYNKANKTYRCSYGSEITVKANPNDGYRFVRWSDGDVNVTRNIVVTANLNLTAQFQEISTPLERFVVRILSSDTELGEVNQVSGNYYDGDQVTLIATPKQHAKFIAWSDGITTATRILTVSSDTTLTAQFEHKRVTVAISAGTGGSVNTEVNGTYNYGEQITIQATPDEGYHFVRWSDGETASVRYINLTEDITLTAVFAQTTYLVTFLNADGSFIEANSYLYGEMPACSVTPTLAPTTEWVFTFTGWSPALAAVTGNAVYTAVYEQEPNPGLGIEETSTNDQGLTTRKILLNGQIFILRGDKIYTIQGQLLK